jgi:hypothetical protein
MDKINVYVCENYLPDFIRICEEKGLTEVAVNSFPSLCADKNKKSEVSKLLAESNANDGRSVVFCSKQCDILKLISPGSNLGVHSMEYCFSHLASESFIDYILKKGGYVIGSG